jgi:hypothetical protein
MRRRERRRTDTEIDGGELSIMAMRQKRCLTKEFPFFEEIQLFPGW